MHLGGEAFDRERCLLAQSCGQCQLAGISTGLIQVSVPAGYTIKTENRGTLPAAQR